MLNAMALKLLQSSRCNLWPGCSCYQTLLHWQHALEEGDDWSVAQLSWAETSIFLALSCVAVHCPSRKYREFAQLQLLNPWWDCQRAGLNRVEQLSDEGA